MTKITSAQVILRIERFMYPQSMWRIYRRQWLEKFLRVGYTRLIAVLVRD